jgi:hypothetical protein
VNPGHEGSGSLPFLGRLAIDILAELQQLADEPAQTDIQQPSKHQLRDLGIVRHRRQIPPADIKHGIVLPLLPERENMLPFL